MDISLELRYDIFVLINAKFETVNYRRQINNSVSF